MHLEDNISFRFRILDVFKNPTSSSKEGFKNALRRELNLWKAFGATPNEATPSLYYSNTATPDILEMSDIEESLDYFNVDGSAKQKFIDLVRYLNEQYPTNWGYFKFNDSVWDTAGLNQDGIDRIKSRYYDDLDSFEKYQPGVGDFQDSSLIVRNNSSTPKYFETKLVATGKKKTGSTPYFAPIEIQYEYQGGYTQKVYDNPNATVNFTLEATILPYGDILSATDVYATKTVYVKNAYGPTSSASPEFSVMPVFDTEGYTSSDIVFKRKTNNNPLVVSINANNSTTRIPFTKVSNLVMKNGKWNGTSYATPNTDSFNAFFSNSSRLLDYQSTSLSASTPAIDQNLSVKIVSKLYSQKTISGITSAVKDNLVLNEGVQNTTADVSMPLEQIQRSIIYPNGATPNKVYINVISPTNAFDSPDQTVDDNIGIYGGVSYDPEIDRNIYIPSSPNIVASVYGTSLPSNSFGFINSENSGSTVNYYFGKIEYSLPSTPNQVIIRSQNGIKYPLQSISWEPFELEASPSISGYVDENGLIKYKNENGEFIPGLNTNILDLFEVTRESFGLSGSQKFNYFFERIYPRDTQDKDTTIWSDQTIVKPFLNRSYVLESSVQNAINNPLTHSYVIDYPFDSIIETFNSTRNTTVFSNIKVRGKLYDFKIDSFVKTGWVHLGKQEYYIYSEPVEEVFSGRFKKINLLGQPKQGAPIIVSVKDSLSTPISYTEIAFIDAATPGGISFTNYETIKPRQNNSFYLGYKDLYNISVKDTYTGETILENATTNTNILEVPLNTKVLNPKRDYVVGYNVNNSYYIDYEYGNNDYITSIYFNSTPTYSGNHTYSFTYENSEFGQATPITIDMNAITSSIGDSYVALSYGNYDFSHIETIVSPQFIINDNKDFIDISIFSYDVNGNRKPHQTFDVSSATLTLSNNRVTTDAEGYAHLTAKCPTSVSVIAKTIAYVQFNGINYSSDSTAHPNSVSGGSIKLDSIEVIPAIQASSNKIYASVSNKVIKADGVSELYINGILLKDNVPEQNKIIYWKKSDYVYTALTDQTYSSNAAAPLNTAFSGIAYSDNNGRFSIGPFRSSGKDNPGYWFVSLESEFSSTLTIPPTNVLAGDVVYWLEDYDALNYNYVDSIRTIDLINYDQTKTIDMYATPSFKISYYNQDTVDVSDQNPRWVPPKWFPTDRYHQYQSGLYGSTPYYIEDYTVIINDYEED